MHTDTVAHEGSEAIVSSALARSVPIISARQFLTWFDGRNGSSFSNIVWTAAQPWDSPSLLGAGANGLEAMIPSNVGSSVLTGITRAGSPVSFRDETIKGVSYAIFSAGAGSYQARVRRRYNRADHQRPRGESVVHQRHHHLDDQRTGRLARRLWHDAGLVESVVAGPACSDTVAQCLASGLTSGTTYYYRVRSADGAGNASGQSGASWAPLRVSRRPTPPSLNCPCTIWPSSTGARDRHGERARRGRARREIPQHGRWLYYCYSFLQGPAEHRRPYRESMDVDGNATVNGNLLGRNRNGMAASEFPQPVAMTANTVYVASYHTNAGFYSFNGAYFRPPR